ncbi:MAG TPA: hypothetical protein VKQ71_15380 [Acidimicrobiales bacterium]|nr:hypothetical protein [Acidimicrobiales bacterium]
MKSGWAARAGTPTALLGAQPASATGGGGTGAAPPATTTPPTGSAGALQLPFTASMAGTLAQSGPDREGRLTITIDATLRAGAAGRLHVVLQGPAVGGGVEMQQSSATFGPAGQPTLYQGRVSALQGTSMVLTLQDGAGHPLRLSLALQIDGATAVSGTVQGSG